MSQAITPDAALDKGWFGHPKGLSTLFFTEMWERLSYYGMRALLMLYMVGLITDKNSGLGFSQREAATIYGIYTFCVYALALPGGIIADKWLGQYKAVFIGGTIIALGHFSLAVQSIYFFYAGLALIVIGTGLLKPNISTMVGSLYEQGDARRDGGFSLFYMGINVGAFIAPLVCGTLGQKHFTVLGVHMGGWHWGFGAAGVGMTLGLVQYWFGRGRLRVALERIEKRKHAKAAEEPAAQEATPSELPRNPGHDLHRRPGIIPTITYWYARLVHTIKYQIARLVHLFTPTEWKRLAVIGVLFIFSTLFWAAFEQAGTSLNQFADRYTNTSALGFSFPSTWFQSLNPLYIILLAPVYSWFWVFLARHKREPAAPMKFVFGMLLVGVGFLVLLPPSKTIANSVDPAYRVSALWLVFVYLFHTMGELSLSPVSLSMVTKLAPQKIVGSIMGIWFLSYALGNFTSGQVAAFFPSAQGGDPSVMVTIFKYVFFATAGSGVVLLFFTKPLTKLMGGIK